MFSDRDGNRLDRSKLSPRLKDWTPVFVVNKEVPGNWFWARMLRDDAIVVQVTKKEAYEKLQSLSPLPEQVEPYRPTLESAVENTMGTVGGAGQ